MAAKKSSSSTSSKSATTSNSKSSSSTSSKSKTTNKSKSTTKSTGLTSTSSSTTGSTQSYERSAAVGEVDANTQAKYNKYNSGEYTQSQSVTDAYNRLQQTLNNKPGAFNSGYQDQLNSIYDKIANREKFNYDFNKDAMYQLYKDRYHTEGRNAMQDTMGQAAQLTGGYGSSYSQTAGQQAYQNYLQALNDTIPTLRAQALQEYESEGNRLNNQFNLANTMYGNDWQQYRANVADWQSDRSYGQGAYTDERNFDYSKYASDRDYTANQYWNQKNAVRESWGATNSTSNTVGSTKTSNTSTTNTSGSSTTNSLSNTLQNSLTNSFTNSMSNTSSLSGGGSGGSGGSSGGSGSSTSSSSGSSTVANQNSYDFYNQMRNIERTNQGSDVKKKQADYITYLASKGVDDRRLEQLIKDFGITKNYFS